MSVSEAKAPASLHPVLQKVEFVCSCGAKYEIQSTLRESAMHVEVCAKCHPFYTGEQKLIDTAGRVENFRRRYEKKVAPAAKAVVTKPEVTDVKEQAKPKKAVAPKVKDKPKKAATKKSDDSSDK